MLRGSSDDWSTPVLTCSALTNIGLDDVWAQISAHHARLSSTGELENKRRAQLVEWTRALVRSRLLARLEQPGVREIVARSEAAVLSGELTADQAAAAIVSEVESGVE
jgi:LAO/AO transport system kinase